jgi:ubiquinone/menaquinone biosynthesis C-methylase UbiE
LQRIPEPELMLDPEQARAYAAADFAAPHERCVALLRERLAGLPAAGSALDLGCGPGDPTLRLARALPAWEVDGVDGSPAMLALAREAAARAGLAARVRFHEARLPAPPAALAGRRFELLFSNSLLHHLADPAALWDALQRFAAPRAFVFVMDLLRPESREAAAALVARHAAGEPAVLRRDFLHSLCAAYRSDEVQAQLRRAGLEDLRCEVASDRHWIVWGRVPGEARGATA